jgi:hypothetical protein
MCLFFTDRKTDVFLCAQCVMLFLLNEHPDLPRFAKSFVLFVLTVKPDGAFRLPQ